MSKESYIAGFTKVAEAHGIDPAALMKIAQDTAAGIGPRVIPAKGVPELKGSYSAELPKTQKAVRELTDTLFPGTSPKLNYLTGKPLSYVELSGDVAKWNWGDFLQEMSYGRYPRGRIQPADIISKLESSQLPNKDALIQRAKANHAKSRGLVGDAYAAADIGGGREGWFTPRYEGDTVGHLIPMRPKVVPKPAPSTAARAAKSAKGVKGVNPRPMIPWIKRVGSILKKAR